MAGDQSKNQIHVSQNAADSSSGLDCSPACQQDQDNSTDYDYTDESFTNGGQATRAGPNPRGNQSSKIGAKTSSQGSPNHVLKGNNVSSSSHDSSPFKRAKPKTKAKSSTLRGNTTKNEGGKKAGKNGGSKQGGNSITSNGKSASGKNAKGCPGKPVPYLIKAN